MNKNITLLAIGLTVLLSGCAAVVPMESSVRDSQAKAFIVKPGTSNIYVYRNEIFGSAIKMGLLLDGRTVGDTGPHTYYALEVTPGAHTILSRAENDSSLDIIAEEGKNSFVWQEVKMGLMSARSQLQNVNEMVGKSGVAESKLAKSSWTNITTQQAKSTPSSESGNFDIAFWDSIKNSTDPAEFQAYMQKFPNGNFEGLAKSRIVALGERAKRDAKVAKLTKERLVLMPLRVGEEDKRLQGSMETALVQGLQQNYVVFSGEQVAQKARAIFLKESHNTSKKVCDETRCMQDIAMAFQAEFIATAAVTKQDGGYFLALSIQNIFDNKVVYSNSVPCKSCDSFQVVDKLKELSNISQ